MHEIGTRVLQRSGESGDQLIFQPSYLEDCAIGSRLHSIGIWQDRGGLRREGNIEAAGSLQASALSFDHPYALGRRRTSASRNEVNFTTLTSRFPLCVVSINLLRHRSRPEEEYPRLGPCGVTSPGSCDGFLLEGRNASALLA